MIGIVDENTPFDVDGRVVYSVAIVLLRNEDRGLVVAAVAHSFDRRRPFHWERDHGAEVRARMLSLLETAPVEIVVVAKRCETRRQAETRETLLDHVVFPAVADRVSSLVIEQRSRAENDQDGGLIRDWSGRRLNGFRRISMSTRPNR